ncbi:hypothetical protein QR680_011832 [Steinernema hermaphroditum]|uniref:SANTA domain-containing protein n=1 Tax=Steinernema hermaphroditum TaxID=289476 RepID=A0AA39I1E5_9BILA|nr:hypothetical protein QR680_011832 [Steinernema hermaphroditum]
MGKEVILRYWSPVVSRSPFQVKVEGFLVDTKTLFSEKKKLYRSSAIVEAIGPRELASKHGTVYVLDGPADLRRCQSIGMPEPLVEQFEMGFPKKYEELLKEWIYPKPKQPEVRDMNYTVEEPDEDDDVRHNNHNHAAKKKHQSSTDQVTREKIMQEIGPIDRISNRQWEYAEGASKLYSIPAHQCQPDDCCRAKP